MTPQTRSIPYGFCHCGCGQKTRICGANCTKYGSVKGEPRRFIAGHQRRIRPVIDQAVPFKINGVYCRLISLTQGLHAIVWESDYRWLMQWKWWAAWSYTTKSYYALRGAERVNKKNNRPLSMQRQILGLTYGDPREADHENHNTLDNTRTNLRYANGFKQAYNRRKHSSNTSGYKGVCYRADKKGPNKWRARINVEGKRILLGYFLTAEDAYKAYCDAALKYHKDFARVS